ncbi:MAG: NAD(P)H-hydrate epimerase [Nitriliruptoraceae bacterium]
MTTSVASEFWPRLMAALSDVPEAARIPPPHARAGAVLVLVEDAEDGPRFVLTRRRQDLRSHPGQVSFPGGRIDDGESVEAAALREAIEEIGLDPASVEVIGIGARFYIPPSRFWVVPVVARWRQPHPLTENPWEVDRILRISLAELLDERRQRHVPMSLRTDSWAWQLDDDLLWGATARVISSVLDVAVDDWTGGRVPSSLDRRQQVHPWEHLPMFPRRTRLSATLPAVEQGSVPHVSAEQMRSVRGWLDQRGVDIVARAEQAGRGVADAVTAFFDDGVTDRRVTVLAGPSSNGASGLVAARLLASRGAHVEVITIGSPRITAHTHLLRDARVPMRAVGNAGIGDQDPGDLVIDAMLGIGSLPPLRDLPSIAGEWLRHHDVPIVALELPSGLSADDGVQGTCLTVDVTVALGLPTLAMEQRMAQAYVGDVYLADLGIPEMAWRHAGVEVRRDLFSHGPLVRLERASQ